MCLFVSRVPTLCVPTMCSLLSLFFFYCYGDHGDLHSFPTRRSSDLRRGAFLGTSRMTIRAGLLRRIGAVPESIEIQARSEEHTSELQSLRHLVCRLLLEKKKSTHNL